ncbi:unnamed protein product [Strongylus vulgaris]|uniref:Uncharacterized protein n=1 Tax=Strongylus vulgaris TaxID=40348 RepID=A0A3P7L7T7_STRVU|nr:unnamed protein product [Strongylus vulgaris]
MDQLRQKVNEKRSRHSDTSKEDDYTIYGYGVTVSESGSHSKNNIEDEDIYVYGDEWSSEDDDGRFAHYCAHSPFYF